MCVCVYRAYCVRVPLLFSVQDDLGFSVTVELREGGWRKHRVYFTTGDPNPAPVYCLVKVGNVVYMLITFIQLGHTPIYTEGCS